MVDPKVSIIMSVYNGERYLREAVESILNQTFRDFEFIVINDASQDRTSQVLNSYTDKRIVIIDNQENIGLTKSLNKGIRKAKGEYIARMDADDISLPERIEKEMDYLEKHKRVSLVGVLAVTIDEYGKEIAIQDKLLTENEEIKKFLIKEGNQFCGPAVMFRKECIEKIGSFREEFKFTQDYDLWLRIAEKYEVANLPEFLYKHRFNPNSITALRNAEQRRYSDFAKELAIERRKYGNDRLETLSKERIERVSKSKFIKAKNLAQGYYYSSSILLCAEDRKKEAKRLAIKSLFFNPFNVNTWRLLSFFFLSPSLVKRIRRIKRSIFMHKRSSA